MKQGSSRYGNDFETICREFFVNYGFLLSGENEIIRCSCHTNHKKQQHEVDIIALPGNYPTAPNPPVYGPQPNERFIVSCKGGLSIDQNDIKDLENQIECIQKDSKYPDIKTGVILCQDKKIGIKLPTNIFIWDRPFLHLLAEKMKVSRLIKNPTNNGGEERIPDRNVSLLFSYPILSNQPNQPPRIISNLNFFNEDPDSSIGKVDIKALIDNLKKIEVEKNFPETQKFVNIYSASGIKSDLLSLKGKSDPFDRTIFYSKMFDLSIATWTPLLENSIF